MKQRIKKQFLWRYQKKQLRQEEVLIGDVEEEASMVTPPKKSESTIFLTDSDVTNLDFLLNEDDEM